MSSTLPAGTCHALIVDDEPVLRQAMARALGRSGFRCDLAGNGRQALQMLAERHYHLVVTDLSMPDMNGHRLAVELLGRADRPVVIVVTGVTEQRIERDLRARGIDEILFKPVDYSSLAARAGELIELRAAQSKVNGPPVPQVLSAPSGKDVVKDQQMPVAALALEVSHHDGPTGSTPYSSEAVSPTSQFPELAHVLAVVDEKVAAESERLCSQNPAFHLASERIDRLEREFSALAKKRELLSLWPLLTFGIGLSLGLLLAFWTR